MKLCHSYSLTLIRNVLKEEGKKLGQRNNPMQFIATSSLLQNLMFEHTVGVNKDTYIFSHYPKGPEEMNFWLKSR